jgi:hypothetical protein
MKRHQSAFVLALIGLSVSVGLREQPTATADISIGLVAYYPLNGNAHDETGHGYNGTVDGATLTADWFGHPLSEYHFDGVNDQILIGHEPNFPSWDTYAMSVWFLNDGGAIKGQGMVRRSSAKASSSPISISQSSETPPKTPQAVSPGGPLKGFHRLSVAHGARLLTPAKITETMCGITRC